MKKSFLFCFLFLFACDVYTIQNGYKEDVMAGFVVLTPNQNQCVEFFDFPVIGDFPIKFRYKNNELFSKKSYPAANYKISEQGEIIKQDKPCEIDIVGEKPEEAKPEEAKSEEAKPEEINPEDTQPRPYDDIRLRPFS